MGESLLCISVSSFLMTFIYALSAWTFFIPVSCDGHSHNQTNDSNMTTGMMLTGDHHTMMTSQMTTDNDHVKTTSVMMNDDQAMMTTDMMPTGDQHTMMTSQMMTDKDHMRTTSVTTNDDQEMMTTETITSMMKHDDDMMTADMMSTADHHKMMTSQGMTTDMMHTMMTAEKTTNDQGMMSGTTTMNEDHTMTTDKNMMHGMTTDMNTSVNMTTGMMSDMANEHMNDSMTTMMNTHDMTHHTTHSQRHMTSSDMMQTPTVMHHSSSMVALSCFSCETTLTMSDCYGMQMNDSSAIVTCAANEICGTVRFDQGFGTDLINVSRICFSEVCPNSEADEMACEMSNPPHRRCVQCCSEHRCNSHVNSKACPAGIDSKMVSFHCGLVLFILLLMTEHV